jgi:hypothetical protein
VVEEIMLTKDGVEVDAPLGEVVGIKVMDDQRRVHWSVKGGSAADDSDGVDGHVWQRKIGATVV